MFCMICSNVFPGLKFQDELKFISIFQNDFIKTKIQHLSTLLSKPNCLRSDSINFRNSFIMWLDQTLHLFTQRIYKTELSLEPWGGPSLFFPSSLEKVKLKKIIKHETMRRLAG